MQENQKTSKIKIHNGFGAPLRGITPRTQVGKRSDKFSPHARTHSERDEGTAMGRSQPTRNVKHRPQRNAEVVTEYIAVLN